MRNIRHEGTGLCRKGRRERPSSLLLIFMIALALPDIEGEGGVALKVEAAASGGATIASNPSAMVGSIPQIVAAAEGSGSRVDGGGKGGGTVRNKVKPGPKRTIKVRPLELRSNGEIVAVSEEREPRAFMWAANLRYFFRRARTATACFRCRGDCPPTSSTGDSCALNPKP